MPAAHRKMPGQRPRSSRTTGLDLRGVDAIVTALRNTICRRNENPDSSAAARSIEFVREQTALPPSPRESRVQYAQLPTDCRYVPVYANSQQHTKTPSASSAGQRFAVDTAASDSWPHKAVTGLRV